MSGRQHFGSVRRLGSGRYQASYWHDGSRHAGAVTFTTKAEARAYLDTVSADLHRGTWIDPIAGTMRVAELAEHWLAANPTKRVTTRATDEIMLRVHLLPTLGRRRIAQVVPADVHGLVSTWATSSAPRTVRRRYGVLRAMFAFAVECDWLARSPCRGVKLPAVTSTRRHTLAPDDVEAIAIATPEEYRLMIWLGAVLGLRWSETAGLRVKSVDVLRRTLSVTETVTRDAKGRPVISAPKSTASARTLAIPGTLADLLAHHMAGRGLTGAKRDELLFTRAGGGPLVYSNWRSRVWLPAIETAGHVGAGYHDLRRASATALVAEGVDVKTAQTRLGHSDPRLTLQVYAEAVEDADRRAAETIGTHFMPIASTAGRPERRRRRHRPSPPNTR